MNNITAIDRTSGASDGVQTGSGGPRPAPAKNGLVNHPDHGLMHRQNVVWNFLMDHYFRMEMDGWHRLPERPSSLVGIHSGGALTMDAWTVAFQWYRRFGRERILHGTAHDVLMNAPGLGDYFRAVGVISPTKEAMGAALRAGDDVVLWPGGEQDSMRSWRNRDTAVLAGRKGFIRFAIRQQVPIVPVATIGGHDTVFVLSEGRLIAKWTGLGKAHDDQYVQAMYREIEGSIQAGMNRLAQRRSFPLFG